MIEVKSGDQQFNVEIEEQIPCSFNDSMIYFGWLDGESVVVKESKCLKHEWEGLSLVWEHGFNVPQPIALDDNEKLMLTSRMFGQPLYEVKDNNPRFDLGLMARNMHQIKLAQSRWRERGCDNVSFYQDRIKTWNLEEIGIDSPTQTILGLLAVTMANHLETVEPGFAHRDLHDEQVMVNNRKIGLLDFGEWGDGDLYREAGMYLFHKVRKEEPVSGYYAFLEGMAGNLSVSEAEVISYYSLFIAANALDYFYKRNSRYLPIAWHNFYSILEFIESEQILK